MTLKSFSVRVKKLVICSARTVLHTETLAVRN